MIRKFLFPTLIITILILSTFLSPQPVKAAGWCSCVTYVKNYFGIPESTGNALAMGTWLAAHGFTRIYSPQVGAVAVMQPGFPGADKTYGHVGIINGVSDMGTQGWRITLKGANQATGGAIITEYDCTNVRNTLWPLYSKSNAKIAYYKADNIAIRSLVVKSGYSSIYWDVSGGSKSAGAYVNGWTYHGGSNQLFNFIRYGTDFRIIARNSGMCVAPQSTSQGARLIQRKCTGHSIEKWQKIAASSGYILKNPYTGFVADLNNGSLSPGTSLLIWSSHNGLNQRWRLELK